MRDIQKFTTSQYWNSGVRITAGVMLPTLVMAQYGWLSKGMPFLWGALFVSLTDTPGPIHHRRNGMLAAILLNTLTVLITGWLQGNAVLQIVQIALFSFFFSMFGIYGARPGAVGTLALVIMLLNMMSFYSSQGVYHEAALTAAGGTWYMGFSLLLYRIQPYRLAEQALGENLMAIGDYIRARAMFYNEEADLKNCFRRVMREQIEVLRIQNQTRDLIFKTRQFVADASPKSRSIMMIFLDAAELFEQTISSYQDYEELRKNLGGTGLLNRFYGIALQLAAEVEYVGLSIQAGIPVKKAPDPSAALQTMREAIHQAYTGATPAVQHSLSALEKTLGNVQHIYSRLQTIVLYTRMEMDESPADDKLQEVSKRAIAQPIRISMLVENLTLRSNHFRYALRLTIAMFIGLGVSMAFSLTHPYWVLLTILTILRPIYRATRKRNIERLAGTLVGVLIAMLLLFFVKDETALLLMLIFSMLIAYSLLRVNYFGFVFFLTIYLLITFRFLNPVEFEELIQERLIDTFIGSGIAALTARFIFPAWGGEELKTSLYRMLETNRNYFASIWNSRGHEPSEAARKEAIVTLTNLYDTFQQIVVEPRQFVSSVQIHQFLIANHMLTSHLNALADMKLPENENEQKGHVAAEAILRELRQAEDNLKDGQAPREDRQGRPELDFNHELRELSVIYSLAHDIRRITVKMGAISSDSGKGLY